MWKCFEKKKMAAPPLKSKKYVGIHDEIKISLESAVRIRKHWIVQMVEKWINFKQNFPVHQKINAVRIIMEFKFAKNWQRFPEDS